MAPGSCCRLQRVNNDIFILNGSPFFVTDSNTVFGINASFIESVSSSTNIILNMIRIYDAT